MKSFSVFAKKFTVLLTVNLTWTTQAVAQDSVWALNVQKAAMVPEFSTAELQNPTVKEMSNIPSEIWSISCRNPDAVKNGTASFGCELNTFDPVDFRRNKNYIELPGKGLTVVEGKYPKGNDQSYKLKFRLDGNPGFTCDLEGIHNEKKDDVVKTFRCEVSLGSNGARTLRIADKGYEFKLKARGKN
jgi:hypothetical protein